MANAELVAFCGLFCEQCKAYKKGKCPGCQASEKKEWCKIRQCNLQHEYTSCAQCREFKDAADCRRLNRFWFRFFAVFVGYDMPGGVRLLKEIGPQAYAEKLEADGRMWVKRK